MEKILARTYKIFEGGVHGKAMHGKIYDVIFNHNPYPDQNIFLTEYQMNEDNIITNRWEPADVPSPATHRLCLITHIGLLDFGWQGYVKHKATLDFPSARDELLSPFIDAVFFSKNNEDILKPEIILLKEKLQEGGLMTKAIYHVLEACESETADIQDIKHLPAYNNFSRDLASLYLTIRK